ncbi:hypothetical protein, partial [Plasmodium yoelii yoelii]
CNINY